MKRTSSAAVVYSLLSLTLFLYSCSQSEEFSPQDEAFISTETLDKIARLGFSTEDVIKDDLGYIVEGDIRLSEEDINSIPVGHRVPEAEQYRTFNLVSAPRTIRIKVDPKLDADVKEATRIAVERYNGVSGLTLNFSLVDGGKADIVVKGARRPNGFLIAVAGFPTSKGAPYNTIEVDKQYRRDGRDLQTMASVMAHEIGHCIGFRHTDWYDRSISCSPGGYEGDENSGIGAEWIPGTPTKDDPVDGNSWMLSCIDFFGNVNRTFTAADSTALQYLY